MAQACERVMDGSMEALKKLSEPDGQEALTTIAYAYLSPQHRDHPGAGCILAALGAEAPRHGSTVRAAFTRGMRSAIETLERLVQPKSKQAKRQRAMTIYASMIGAMVLASAVDDPELSEEVLRSVLASITNSDAGS